MLEQAFWPESRLLAGVNRLAQTLGCELLNATTSVHSLKQYAESLGVEALSTQTHYGDLQQTLRRLVPGVVAITYQGKPAYVFISGNHRHQLELQLPNGGSIRCGVATLAEFIREDRGYKPDVNLEAVLVDLGLQGKRLARAKQILLQQQLAGCAIAGLWLLRPHANLGLKAAATYARLGHYVLGFTVAHIAERTALIAGVSLLGYAITHGQWAASLVITWLLIMLTCWVFGAFGQACQVQLEVRFGLLIKRQLQQGAMQLSPEALANKGPAQLLGQAMEADGLQNNALLGVFTAINAAMDMLIGLGIALFLQQWLLSGVLVAFIVASSYPVVQFGRAYRVWAKRRTQLSHLTIEHMQGNRTRLMQSGPSRWHKDEERQLHYYWLASVRMDRFALWLQAIIPCLWLMCASAILCVAILFSQLPMAQLAALLGVILLVWQAWRSMADSCQQLARTWHSWQEIKALLSHNGPSSSGPHTPNLPSQSAHSQSAHLQSAHLQSAQSQHSPSYSSQEPQFKPSTLVVNQVAYAYAANKPILQSVDLHLQQDPAAILLCMHP